MRLFATLLLISASSGAFAAQPQALHCERLFDARSGKVLGLYLHGRFEDPAAMQGLFGKPGGAPVRTLDGVFDGLADALEAHFAPGVLNALVAA